MTEREVASAYNSHMEGALPSTSLKVRTVRYLLKKVRKECFIAGLCLLLCHTRLKWMLGGRCHITDKMQQLIIVTLSQGTVWKQGEFGTDAPTRYTKHMAQS